MPKRTLEVVVAGDTSGLEKALKRSGTTTTKFGRDVDRSNGKMSKSFASVAKTAKVASLAVAGGLAIGLKKVIDEATEARKVTAQTEAVIKSTGHAAGITAKQVADLSTAISNKTGIDDEAIQSSANLLLTFTNVRNEAGKGNDIFNQATQTITDMSVALGQDGKSSAIQLGKALNDPIKGITALSRVGVSFTADQKKQITSLVEHGDTLKAQKVILRELNKEFGGSAAAAATPMQKLKTTLDNVAETLGTALLPYLDAAAKAVQKFIMEMQSGEGAGGKFVRVIEDIASALSTGFQGAVTGARAAISGIKVGIAALITAFNATKGAITTALHAVTAAFNTVKNNKDVQVSLRAVANAFKIVVTAIKIGLIPVMITLRPTLAAVAFLFRATWTVVKNVVVGAIGGIITVIKGFAQILRGSLRIITGILTGDFGRAWDGVKDIFEGGIKVAVLGPLKTIAGALRGLVRAAGSILLDGFRTAWNLVRGTFNMGIKSTLAIIRGASAPFRAAARAIGRVLLAGFDVVRGLASRIGGFFSSALKHIKGFVNAYAGAAKRVGTAVVSAIGGIVSKLPGKVSGYFSSVARVLGNQPERMAKLAGRIADRIVGAFKNIGSKIVRVLKDAFNAALALINKAIDAVNKITPGAIKIKGHAVTPALPDIPHVPGVRKPVEGAGSKGKDADVFAVEAQIRDIQTIIGFEQEVQSLNEQQQRYNALKAKADKRLRGGKKHADERREIKDARRDLRDLNEELDATERLTDLNFQLEGLEKAKAFQDTIKDIRTSLAAAVAQAKDAFIDTRLKGELAGIEQGAEAQRLATLQADDAAAARAQTDQELGDKRTEAVANVKAAEDALALAQRKQNPKAVAAAQQALTAAKDDLATAERDIANTSRQREMDALEQSLQTQRDGAAAKADIAREGNDAEANAYAANLQGQLDGLVANLNARQLSYAQYVAGIQGLLGGLAPEATPEQELVFTEISRHAPDKVNRKKKKKGKASGGLAVPNMVYRVGEVGPEDVTFGAKARITPASRSSRGAGGVTINMNGPIRMGGTTDAHKLAHKLGWRIATAAG